MADANPHAGKIGAITSADLTLPDPEEILNFYQQVVGWTSEPLQLQDDDGAYEDYVVKDSQGNWVGGICHARGANLGLPPVWLIYVQVADIEASLAQCVALGGQVVKRAEYDGALAYAVIRDPAGAFMALVPTG